MKNRVAIIIVNWNGLNLLKNCFDGIKNQSFYNFDLYFVDNNSIDESVLYVEKVFPKAKIMRLDKNYGFAKANNIAIKKALLSKNIEFIVCLNNDTLVHREWLEQLVKSAESKQYEHNKIGMVASKSYFPDNTIQNAGIEIIKNKKGWYIEAVARGANEDDKKNNEYNSSKLIFGPSGNSALYTSKMLSEIGLFDDDFFAYMEDVDLALRAQNKGYSCLYCPNSTLIHYHSKTSRTASPFKAFYSKRNLYLMGIKNFSLLELINLIFIDFYSNINKFFSKNNKDSISSLKKEIGSFQMIILMIKIYLNIIIKSPKFLFKRFKTKKV